VRQPARTRFALPTNNFAGPWWPAFLFRVHYLDCCAATLPVHPEAAPERTSEQDGLGRAAPFILRYDWLDARTTQRIRIYFGALAELLLCYPCSAPHGDLNPLELRG
jgi:hypothetical protein